MAMKSYKTVLKLLLCLLISSGLEVNGLSYDYSFTPECLSSPPKPQYGGGIVVNPELNEEGLKGWSKFGDAKLAKRVSKDGNNFVVAFDRKGSNDGLSQEFVMQKGILYVISAWLRVSHGNSIITAAFNTSAGVIRDAGSVSARSGCWSMLKGGLTANESGAAHLYFRSDRNSTVEIWADSISLQPFTQAEWESHRNQSIEKIRKSMVRFQAVDSQGQPLTGANFAIQQLSNGYPFGSAINLNILSNQAYQNWFTSRFKYTVFENEMKWYSTETSPGHEDYSVADAMVRLAKNHGITIRGHNIFWDDFTYNPWWVKTLSPNDLRSAADRRIWSIAQRYKGQVVHWDVVNENIHNNFLESKLGPSASSIYYQKAHQIDPNAIPFLNEYNTLERKNDKASPSNYLAKIKEIRSQGYSGPLGIGLEGHFDAPDLAYIRASLDVLGSAKLPIWVTELDVGSGPNQATYLEQILWEVHAHWAVNGILMWTAWSPKGCWRMCLTDNNFKNLPTGDVVDKILHQWQLRAGLVGTADADGQFQASLYHGDYEVKISHPDIINHTSSPMSVNFKVAPTTTDENVLNVKLSTIN